MDLADLDLEGIADALQDNSYEHNWFIDPTTGEIEFVSEFDDERPDLDDTDLVRIEPLPSWVWYQDMADFAAGIADEQASRRLARAIRGRGAFRHFKDELYEEYPALVSLWHAFSNRRALRRAVEWLLDASLVDRDAAEAFLSDNPEIELAPDAA